MAFFGITYLGYQNPVGDRMLPSARNKPDSRDSSHLHLGRHQDGIRRIQGCKFIRNALNTHTLHLLLTKEAPKELYRVPVTENQKYGWWVPNGGLKNQESWTRTRHFPRKNSEMTKFVNEMSMTYPEFCLF